MLLELQTAIFERFNSAGGATLRGLVQGMWESAAPSSLSLNTQRGEELQNSTLPIIVFDIVATGLQQDFCTDMFEPLVQYSIFGDANNKSSLEVLNVSAEFLSLYGMGVLYNPMINNYTMISNKVVGQRKNKTQEKFWQVIYELQYIVEVDR